MGDSICSADVKAAMDTILAEGFPKVGGKPVIFTLVDRFSKYAHFIALGHPTARHRSPKPSLTRSCGSIGSMLHGQREGPGLHQFLLD